MYRARKQLANPKHRSHAKYTGSITFAQFVHEWAEAKRSPRTAIGTSVEFCVDEAGSFFPITYYRYEDLDRLVDRLAAHIGERPELGRVNVSDKTETDNCASELVRLPKLARTLELYDKIPFAT